MTEEPRVPAQGGTPSSRTSKSSADGGPAPQVRLLIADDSREVRWLIGLLLEDEPSWQVVGEAADGAEAVVRAEELRPDVVLIDMSMPVMDGLEALPQLRDLLPDALLVLVTAFPVGDVVGVARTHGADACLDKIDMATTLVPALRRLLEEQRETREPQPGRTERLSP